MAQLKSFTAMALAAAALAGCATTGGEGARTTVATADPRIDQNARAGIVREDMLTQMAFWASEYSAFPEDLQAAQHFADTLRRGGRVERATEIAMEALQRFPGDISLLTTLGLAQIAVGRPQEALRPLAMVAAAEPQNWRVRSALGAALDQVGRFNDARRAYQEALAIAPDTVVVLTNLGVSHLLSGEAEEAEAILRRAVDLPGAPPQARQNLAVALALQGRFDEAEHLERVDLPPNIAAQNMSYLRGLTSDDRRWGDLEGQSSESN